MDSSCIKSIRLYFVTDKLVVITKDILSYKLYLLTCSKKYKKPGLIKGSPPSKEGPRHNTETREYSTVANIEEGYIDKVTAADCDHLPTENFEGMSVAAKMLWEPGKPFTFSRNAIHCSNNWHRIGIKSKLGLSLFTRSTS